MNFVGAVVAEHGLAAKSVLEVGSFDVNGSVRSYFTGPYLGTDMQPGPGVHEVMLAANVGMRYPERFDVVISTEVAEHDPAPWLSLEGMCAAAKPDGFLILTARGFDERGAFQVHGFPDDHYRYSVSGMACLLAYTGWDRIYVERDPEHPGILATARRP